MNSDADERLLAPYRAVRNVGAGDVPWPGMLVRLASGESRLLVDAALFDDDWAGWRAEPDAHLLAPLDVVRRSDGHSIVLPLCSERLADFVARRSSAHLPLSAGEVVTIAVSLVRGVLALDAASAETGEWWLTDAGRPVLAVGASGHEPAAHTADLLRSLGSGPSARAPLETAAAAIASTRRSSRDLRSAEEDLFAIAAPEPLATSLFGPRAARDLFAFEREEVAPAETAERFTWVDSLTRHVDADLADVVSRATTGVWRRMRRAPSRSRKPWLLASGAAAAVLTAGVLWPSAGGGPATADSPRPPAAEPTVSVTETPTPTATPSGTAGAPVDLAAVTNTLLDARAACAADSACLSTVMLNPADRFDAGVIDLAASQRQTTLLDDFGGVAVLRIDALDGALASQLVVVMLDHDRWLLRDVHAAKQP